MQGLAGSGAQITNQSPMAVSGNVVTKGRPSWIIAVLLFLLCFVPGVVYLINASKDVVDPFAINLLPQDGGTWVSGSGTGRGMHAVASAIAQLPPA